MKFSALVVLIVASVTLASPAAVGLLTNAWQNISADRQSRWACTAPPERLSTAKATRSKRPALNVHAIQDSIRFAIVLVESLDYLALCCEADNHLDSKWVLLHMNWPIKSWESTQNQSYIRRGDTVIWLATCWSWCLILLADWILKWSVDFIIHGTHSRKRSSVLPLEFRAFEDARSRNRLLSHLLGLVLLRFTGYSSLLAIFLFLFWPDPLSEQDRTNATDSDLECLKHNGRYL